MKISIACYLFTGTALAACADSSPASQDGFADQEILIDYADKVIVPTYQVLAMRAQALAAAIARLQTAPTQANLAAARIAWEQTREPWELSEAHLFGPVSGNGYDPAMDSWPVERNDLDAVLASGNTLSAQFIRGLPETQKGFHTIEYLLWGNDATKQAGALTTRELEYLSALAAELVSVTTALTTSWTSGLAGAPAYRTVFVTAGLGSTAYPSAGAAAQEILNGMSGIADEVANGKIADPYDAHDPEKVESQFSFNSLVDFANNIRGIKISYTGDAQVAGLTGRGIDEFIAQRDPALDARFKQEIDDAIAAIARIPAPFRTAITTPASYPLIEAAQTKIRKVQNTIDADLLPLLGQ